MTAIDYASIPEFIRQNLLAATYKMAQQMFQDPEVVKEYEIWLRHRKESQDQGPCREPGRERQRLY